PVSISRPAKSKAEISQSVSKLIGLYLFGRMMKCSGIAEIPVRWQAVRKNRLSLLSGNRQYVRWIWQMDVEFM
ncbi:MAG: hypothetical protein ACRCU9_15870, partial [Iodobacter sp.]